MRAALLARLAKLELTMPAGAPPIFRYGWLRQLPKDFKGERHVVSIETTPMNSSDFEWCEFEERPGSAPLVGDRSFTVYLTE